MIITTWFYRISISNLQPIPPTHTSLLWKPSVFQSLRVSIWSVKKFLVSIVQMSHGRDSIGCGCLTVWLASRSLIVSRSTHVAANAFPSFLFMAESHSFASMDHIFIHASVDGHWGGFLVLALVQSAATHNGVHGSFRAMVFSGEMTGVGFLDQMLILVWVFWGLSLLCSTVLYKLTFPPLVSQGSLCSTPSPHFLFADVCLHDGHAGCGTGAAHRAFALRFPNSDLITFSCVSGPSVHPLWRTVCWQIYSFSVGVAKGFLFFCLFVLVLSYRRCL